MAYYTLISKHDDDTDWHPQFGDYDRETVQDEMDNYKDDYGWINTSFKIIRTMGSQQFLIDDIIAVLNGKEALK